MIYDFEKEIFNIHSVYVHCPECFGWGINMPLNRKCDAGHNDGIAYYDAESIDKLISSLLQAQREKDKERLLEGVVGLIGYRGEEPALVVTFDTDDVRITAVEFEDLKQLINKIYE